jgi:hypothetical protein
MTVVCPGCRRPIPVPPDKADIPNLRARCKACGTSFLVAEASLALAPSAMPVAPVAAVGTQVAGVARAVPATPAGPQPNEASVAPPGSSRVSQGRGVSGAGALASGSGVLPVARTEASSGQAVPAEQNGSGEGLGPGARRPPVPVGAFGGRTVAPSATGQTSTASAASVASAARPPASRPGLAPPAPARRPSHRSGARRQCAQHSDKPSDWYCNQCQKALCGECVVRQGTAAICTTCDGLCMSTAEIEKKEATARQRARPLREDIGVIFRYPFTDTMAYVILAVVVFVFGLAASIAAFGRGVGILFSQGLLYAYAFTAVNRVSSGEMKGFMPPISDITDLVAPLRVGLAALLVSSGPFFILLFLFPAVSLMDQMRSPAQEPAAVEASPSPGAMTDEQLAAYGMDEEEIAEFRKNLAETEPPVELPSGPPFWILPALALALLWKMVYSPVALVAGAISRSFLSTLNPVTGIRAMIHMGSVYWEAMIVYTLLAIAETILALVFGWIPIAGQLVMAFVQSYVFLVVGCLLGLAVFKKAPELGLE